MGNWIALAGLLAVVGGGFGRVAYKSDRKWPAFRDAVLAMALVVLSAGMGFWLGAFFASKIPEHTPDFLTAAGAAMGGAIVAILLALLANGLREPNR